MRILLDSRKSTGGESLRESLDYFTFVHKVSYSLYENLFGFSQNILGEVPARMDPRNLAEFLTMIRISFTSNKILHECYLWLVGEGEGNEVCVCVHG